MNPEPSDDAVDSLMSMGICLNRQDAVSRLQANGNDIQRAIETYFEAPQAAVPEVATVDELPWANDWAESQYRAGKDQLEDPNLQPFPVHSSDDQGENLQQKMFSAPSRPPSRVNNRDITDLTEAHAAADPSRSLGPEDRESADMRKALALSMGQTEPQETGITNVMSPQFGPANRSFYDASAWAMTLAAPMAHDIVLDPEPVHRVRVEGEPAYLRPSTSGPYVSSLLTIFHAIPRAREAFLLREALLPDYGSHEGWWKGARSELGATADANVDTDTHTDANESLHTLANADILHEPQRIMAFLDATERLYGSVDVLTDLVPEQTHDEMTTQILDAWHETAVSRSLLSPEILTFRSVGIKMVTDTEQELGRSISSTIAISLKDSIANRHHTLYDAIDEHIWETTSMNDSISAFLDEIAEVFTITIMRADLSRPIRGITIPPVWYPDRYMKKSLGLAAEMRKMRKSIHEELEQITMFRARLTSYQKPDGSGPVVDPRKLLETAIKYFDTQVSAPCVDQAAREVESQNRPTLDVVAELKGIHDKLLSKLEALDQQEVVARTTLEKISAQMTEPDPTNPSHSPVLRYTIRGVITDPHITYVLYPTARSPSAATIPSSDDAPSTSPSFQWFRLSFSTTDAINPVTCMKVDEDLVLHAASDEGRMAVLIYASELAMSLPYAPLPPALETFVERDNKLFEAELTASAALASVSGETVPSLRENEMDGASNNFGKRKASSGMIRTEDKVIDDSGGDRNDNIFDRGRGDSPTSINAAFGSEVSEVDEPDEVSMIADHEKRANERSEREVVEIEIRPVEPGNEPPPQLPPDIEKPKEMTELDHKSGGDSVEAKTALLDPHVIHSEQDKAHSDKVI